jgi:hypothetical protein
MWTTLFSLALAAAVCFGVAAECSGIQQIFGAAERITRERGVWRPWLRNLTAETTSKGQQWR